MVSFETKKSFFFGCKPPFKTAKIMENETKLSKIRAEIIQLRTIPIICTLRSPTPYPLRSCIWKTSSPLTEAASLVRLCLPLPPTPTRRALPRGDSRIRLIRQLKESKQQCDLVIHTWETDG